MRLSLKSTLIYPSILMLANAAHADPDQLRELRSGDMRKLIVHDESIASSTEPFIHEDGSEITLANYQGKVVVLNFWATWCAPCRIEMPHLSALQTELGGDDLAVVTVATGRNPLPAIDTFFASIEVENLPQHTDPRQSLARSLGVLGLPATLILDRDGREIGRLQGEADWNSQNAHTILTAIMNGDS